MMNTRTREVWVFHWPARDHSPQPAPSISPPGSKPAIKQSPTHGTDRMHPDAVGSNGAMVGAQQHHICSVPCGAAVNDISQDEPRQHGPLR